MKTRHAIRLYEDFIKSKGFSRETLRKYVGNLEIFCEYYNKMEKADDVRDIRFEDLNDFFVHLKKRKNQKGELLSSSALSGYNSVLKNFFEFLVKYEYIFNNPFNTENFAPAKKMSLRKSIDVDKVLEFLNALEDGTDIGIRNRAVFELLYGTGIRLSELINLNVTDVDFGSAKILIREGKGSKDRIVPAGNNLLRILKTYISAVRKKYLDENKVFTGALFLTVKGERLGSQSVYRILKKYFESKGIEGICTHMLRHSFATHILERGAKIMQVKEILGHSSLSTTVIYTQFSVTGLKRIMKKYHPRENEIYEEMTSEKRNEYIRILTRLDPRC